MTSVARLYLGFSTIAYVATVNVIDGPAGLNAKGHEQLDHEGLTIILLPYKILNQLEEKDFKYI
uniref:Uncharacterized protein n=1 Tax=Wuchereria bancrofti TaxID=6293 RepID=A0AAF5Q3F0_WUCBA